MKGLLHRFNSTLLSLTRTSTTWNRLRQYQQRAFRRGMNSTAMPALWREMSDGSEEEISEEDLYKYSRYRWLKDESDNFSMRCRRFNLVSLIEKAIKAAGEGAQTCVKILKCTEGQYNKAFLMTMDNGIEVLGKLPNPNAGPEFYTTASEVATRNFLSSVLHLPTPRIYTSSANSLNPVGAEYIIEEKAKGRPLGSLWHRWQAEEQLALVSQVVEFQKRLTSISFRMHGCIYFKDDLERRGLLARPLEARRMLQDGPGEILDPELISKFAVGPLTESRQWDGERSGMNLDRGPWSSPVSYMAAMGINEIQWAKAYAKPRINAYRSMETPESPNDYISLLTRYLQLIPHISPGPFWTTLSHLDLHLDNIFVDPETKRISCVIDWQSTSMSEPYFHKTPRMLLPVSSRASDSHLEGVSEVSRSAGDDPLRLYEKLSISENPQYWAAVNLGNGDLITEPVSLVCGAWGRDDVFSLRHSLILLAAKWEELAPGKPFPISFTKEELQLHEGELDLVEGLGEILNQLHRDNMIPLGGMVLREGYEQALHVNRTVKQMFVDMAETESQKALHSRIWPYQDQDI